MLTWKIVKKEFIAKIFSVAKSSIVVTSLAEIPNHLKILHVILMLLLILLVICRIMNDFFSSKIEISFSFDFLSSRTLSGRKYTRNLCVLLFSMSIGPEFLMRINVSSQQMENEREEIP